MISFPPEVWSWLTVLGNWLADYSVRLLGAALVVLSTWWLATAARRITRFSLLRRRVDATIESFVSSLFFYGILLIGGIAALTSLGVSTASLLAVLGAAGLAIGLALQGSLSNFAASVLLVIFRPYKVGDTIRTNNEIGKVTAIQIFNTVLISPDNKTVIIPNAQITANTITNFSTIGVLRIDIELLLSDENDWQQVKQLLLDILKTQPNVLPKPEGQVHLIDFLEDIIKVGVSAYVEVGQAGAVRADLLEKIKLQFDANSIQFAERQLIVERIGTGGAKLLKAATTAPKLAQQAPDNVDPSIAALPLDRLSADYLSMLQTFLNNPKAIPNRYEFGRTLLQTAWQQMQVNEETKAQFANFPVEQLLSELCAATGTAIGGDTSPTPY
jgi:small conductance mechanosensitive channel